MQRGVPRCGVGSAQEKFPLPWLSLKISGGNQGSGRILPEDRILLGEFRLTEGGILGQIWCGFRISSSAAGEGLPEERDGEGMFHHGNDRQRQISTAVPKL